ncbi:MAG TPA: hypothetical protein VLM75_12590 [Spirochaetota bacterium]|nr:hypothetical protein [Spirochaetota bacterium]
MMKTESPFTDAAGRRIRGRDAIEVKYGDRYTVIHDAASGRLTAVDFTGHHRIAPARLMRYCKVVELRDPAEAGIVCAD